MRIGLRDAARLLAMRGTDEACKFQSHSKEQTMKLATIAVTLALALSPAAVQADDMKKMDANENEASKAYYQAMMKMHQKMTIKPSGNADVDFATGMIPHHEGAIDMARVELKFGKDPELRKLAEAIVKAQDSEIALMKSWLEKNAK
jgi:uncharacterized protein (DUF305 family)